MNKNVISQLILILLFTDAVFLSSCASLSKDSGLNPNEQLLWDRKASAESRKNISYILGPDDIVNITVEQHPEWSGQFTVGPNGVVIIPGIGEVEAGDISPELFEINLSIIIAQFITNPRVTVNVTRYASQTIYVLGAVNQPGQFSTGGKNISLRDAIVMAGLPLDYAATKRVYVITPSKKKPTQEVINLYRILYRGETKRNVILNPGDIVYVPRTLLGNVIEFLNMILSPLSSTVAARTAVGMPVVAVQ